MLGFLISELSSQFTMEMAGSEILNIPKSYSLNMSKDFVPMGIFSESIQGVFLIWSLNPLSLLLLHNNLVFELTRLLL